MYYNDTVHGTTRISNLYKKNKEYEKQINEYLTEPKNKPFLSNIQIQYNNITKFNDLLSMLEQYYLSTGIELSDLKTEAKKLKDEEDAIINHVEKNALIVSNINRRIWIRRREITLETKLLSLNEEIIKKRDDILTNQSQIIAMIKDAKRRSVKSKKDDNTIQIPKKDAVVENASAEEKAAAAEKEQQTRQLAEADEQNTMQMEEKRKEEDANPTEKDSIVAAERNNIDSIEAIIKTHLYNLTKQSSSNAYLYDKLRNKINNIKKEADKPPNPVIESKISPVVNTSTNITDTDNIKSIIKTHLTILTNQLSSNVFLYDKLRNKIDDEIRDKSLNTNNTPPEPTNRYGIIGKLSPLYNWSNKDIEDKTSTSSNNEITAIIKTHLDNLTRYTQLNKKLYDKLRSEINTNATKTESSRVTDSNIINTKIVGNLFPQIFNKRSSNIVDQPNPASSSNNDIEGIIKNHLLNLTKQSEQNKKLYNKLRSVIEDKPNHSSENGSIPSVFSVGFPDMRLYSKSDRRFPKVLSGIQGVLPKYITKSWSSTTPSKYKKNPTNSLRSFSRFFNSDPTISSNNDIEGIIKTHLLNLTDQSDQNKKLYVKLRSVIENKSNKSSDNSVKVQPFTSVLNKLKSPNSLVSSSGSWGSWGSWGSRDSRDSRGSRVVGEKSGNLQLPFRRYLGNNNAPLTSNNEVSDSDSASSSNMNIEGIIKNHLSNLTTQSHQNKNLYVKLRSKIESETQSNFRQGNGQGQPTNYFTKFMSKIFPQSMTVNSSGSNCNNQSTNIQTTNAKQPYTFSNNVSNNTSVIPYQVSANAEVGCQNLTGYKGVV